MQPAIRRNLAAASGRHLTPSRDPRNESLHFSGTPTGRCSVGLQPFSRQQISVEILQKKKQARERA
jgi:hypothetical protein